MDNAVTYHRDLEASGRWAAMPFSKQMANIGSEISRACRWKAKQKPDMMWKAVERGLELLDLTVECASGPRRYELLRLRETICDYFLGGNQYKSEERQLQKYFDAFAYI